MVSAPAAPGMFAINAKYYHGTFAIRTYMFDM